MSHRTLTVEKVTPQIGVEVLGVDLARPLDEPTFKAGPGEHVYGGR